MNKNNITLRTQAFIGSAFLCFGVLAVAIGSMFALGQVDRTFQQVRMQSEDNRHHVMPLVRHVAATRFHIVQVQQWLTDISATRGEDGLDDGPAEAASHAKSVTEMIAKAREEAQTLKLDSIDRKLAEVAAAFPAFYQQGQVMADAYVSGGTKAGNQSMGAFDDAASSLASAVNDLQALVDQHLEVNDQALDTAVTAVNETVFMAYLVMGLLGLALLLAIGYILRRQLVVLAGLRRTAKVALAAAAGDLNGRILGIWRNDELGNIQRAVNRVLDYTEAYVSESSAALLMVSRGEYFRTIQEPGMNGSFLRGARTINQALLTMENKISDFRDITQSFEKSVQLSVGQVSTSATGLQQVSGVMHGAANENQSLSRSAATAMESASADVQAVAGASTQLSASILEISRQVNTATNETDKAVRDIEAAGKQVATLSEAAHNVGEVVQIITDIASQTNLLALNATIEAARAGDAGKGFAVVANEVKSLAQQTSRATDQIADQIAQIQSATKSAVEAISGIGGMISAINEVVTSVAAAVEEQEAATREINERVERVAVETQGVSDSISGVQHASEHTGSAAQTVATSADNMAHAAQTLNTSVNAFLNEVRRVV